MDIMLIKQHPFAYYTRILRRALEAFVETDLHGILPM